MLFILVFLKKGYHSIILFIETNRLSVHSLYYKRLSELMHDLKTDSAPIKIRSLFMKTSDVHSYSNLFAQ